MPKWQGRDHSPWRYDSASQRGRDPAQIYGHLPEELVGAEAIVVPDRDLEDARTQVLRPEGRVDKRLVPLRIASVDHRFRSPLGLLTAGQSEEEDQPE